MNYQDIKKRKAIEQRNKERWLEVNPSLSDDCGIYVLTRSDENGFRYAYVGQAKHVLTRLAEHLVGFQHIDLSLKKHGLWGEQTPYGWFVFQRCCDAETLDAQERYYIKYYAALGFQLRNKTLGGQGEGKAGISENKPSKGYYDGKKQGRKDLAKELKSAVKYLNITPKDAGKRAQAALDKFTRLLVTDEEQDDERR